MFYRIVVGKPYDAWVQELEDQKRLSALVTEFFKLSIARSRLTPQVLPDPKPMQKVEYNICLFAQILEDPTLHLLHPSILRLLQLSKQQIVSPYPTHHTACHLTGRDDVFFTREL